LEVTLGDDKSRERGLMPCEGFPRKPALSKRLALSKVEWVERVASYFELKIGTGQNPSLHFISIRSAAVVQNLFRRDHVDIHSPDFLSAITFQI
jgi:hypothetical protein